MVALPGRRDFLLPFRRGVITTLGIHGGRNNKRLVANEGNALEGTGGRRTGHAQRR